MSKINVKTCEQFSNEGKTPEILFWIGCSGSFDDRAKKITKAFIKILNHAKIDFAVLGKDESCTGDPAKRAGNEFLFQMQALSNIKVLNTYNIKKIVTTCPHCFNIIKNEGYKKRVPEILSKNPPEKPWNLLKDGEGDFCFNNIDRCVFNSSSSKKIFMIGFL